MEKLMDKSILELAPLLQTKQLSPVDLVKECLQRIEETEPTLNAYITVLHREAMESAALAEKEILGGHYKGVLHGIPYSAKDLYTTKGIRTTAGSKVLEHNIPDYDATAIIRLREAGAVLVGKNNLHEFAFGGTNENEYFGPARNPWNPAMNPGGSSGGSAASVAASSSIFSLGTDTAGSIRIPASFCGIVGMKGTYGRVSRRGVLPLSSSLDHAGPLAKTTWDAAAVMSVIAGYDPLDPSSSSHPVPDYTEAFSCEGSKPFKGMRVGVCERYFFERLDPQVERAVRSALLRFEELGAELVAVDVPDIYDAVNARGIISLSEIYAYHSGILKTSYEEYGSNIRKRLETGQYIPAWAYINAQRLRTQHLKAWDEVYQKIDLLVSPTMAIPAFPIYADTISLDGNEVDPRNLDVSSRTPPSNFNGYPAVSIPCGLTEEGLPIGLQIQGRPFEEGLVFRSAYFMEQLLASGVSLSAAV
ncbi:amidase [Paenibacillus abyssi]|uniref:Amidase n=1 Tax=Paenibacillus abyssi TaxID=1340531 RepID=A0A917D401_9BACL|nr:amidase [Paenibacillus abyssi]GGG06516.1 amidase [Paenibacillus abyssi]